MSGIRRSEQPWTPEQHAANLLKFYPSPDEAVTALKRVQPRRGHGGRCTIETEDADHMREVMRILQSKR